MYTVSYCLSGLCCSCTPSAPAGCSPSLLNDVERSPCRLLGPPLPTPSHAHSPLTEPGFPPGAMKGVRGCPRAHGGRKKGASLSPLWFYLEPLNMALAQESASLGKQANLFYFKNNFSPQDEVSLPLCSLGRGLIPSPLQSSHPAPALPRGRLAPPFFKGSQSSPGHKR